MQTVKLNKPVVIAGAVRQPAEGPITVSDEEAEKHRSLGNLDEEEGEQEDDLDGLTLIDLNLIVVKEGVALNGATKKADVIAAIRAKREADTKATA